MFISTSTASPTEIENMQHLSEGFLMKFVTRGILLFYVVCLLTFSSSAFGQAVFGSIFGSVTDTTGAVVPDATITVTDEAKGTSVNVQSNGSGEFTVEHLIPDVYDVKVVAKGFKGYEQKGIQLFADTSVKVTAPLSAGGSDQTVEVNADTVPQLKTDRADVSTVFDSKDIGDLPVGNRNFTNLQLLLPGAQLLGWNHAPDENPQGSAQIQVDGQAFGGVAFSLDGTDNQDPILGIIVINPNVDSLSETKITTQNFDAEFGKAVSSVMTAQTKSGTNNFHGSAFDYRISTANLAKDPFNQFPAVGDSPASTIAPGLKSLFGGSVGGPIIKDKIFFFGDYQGTRQKVGTTSSTIVPTALTTSSCLSGNGCNFSDYAGIGSYSIYQANGIQYPGNIIPQSQLSVPALNYIKAISQYAPNKIGASGLLDTYVQGGTGIFNSDSWDVRLDGQVSDRAHAFVRFSRFTDVLSGTTLLGAAGGPGFGLSGYGGDSSGHNDSVATGMDIALNSKLVTDFRLGYYRYNIADQKFDESTQAAAALGFGGLNTADPITNGLPGFQITMPSGGQTEWGAGLNINRCNCPLIEREDQFQVVNNWTRTIGNHSVKLGVDLRYARNLRVPSDSDRTGLFAFNANATASPGTDGLADAAGSGGLGLASFLLGDPSQFNRYVSTSTNAKEFQKRDFFYLQDTWRTTPKLTLNLGIRYELYFPEAVNGPGNGSLMNLSTGYLSVAGIGGVPSDMGWKAGKNTWNPRIGVAYQATDKTVIRAGYGRSFDLGVFGSIFGHVVTQNLPVLANQAISGTGSNAATYSNPYNLVTGPEANVFPTVPSDGLLPNPGYAVSTKARPNPLRLPTLDAWNLSVQQSITPTLSLTMAYVGNKGTHTLSAGDGNNTNPNEGAVFLPAQYSVTGQPLHYDPAGGNCFPVGPGCTTANAIGASGAVSTGTFLQRYYGGTLPACTDPAYAQPAGLPAGACGWNQSIGYYGDDQNTHYNALQVTVAKQVSHGLSFTSNYAWQRAFNYNSNYATWVKSAAYGRDDSIREQQVVTYGVYELPFGRNKQFLSQSPRFLDEIIGGWQLSPVINLSSGLPYSLSMIDCASSVGGNQLGGRTTNAPCFPDGNPGSFHPHLGKLDPVNHDRPYFAGFSTLCPSSGASYASTGGFTCPGLDQIGNTGRNSNFGPGFFNTDLAVQKNFPIRESISATFRMDAFNVFNHISAANPNGNATAINVDSAATITNGAGGNGVGPVGQASPRQLAFTARIQF
jgi:outer membrane receptor protein involved in Fe transport